MECACSCAPLQAPVGECGFAQISLGDWAWKGAPAILASAAVGCCTGFVLGIAFVLGGQFVLRSVRGPPAPEATFLRTLRPARLPLQG